MRSADSLTNLLQKAYATLPISQRAAGSITLEDFANVLLPVLCISATPFRDRVIDYQVGQVSVVAGPGNTQALFIFDDVPSGEIHRYLALTAHQTGALAVATVQIVSNASTLAFVRREIDNLTNTNLLAPSDIRAGSLDVETFVAGTERHLDVYPGGSLRVAIAEIADTETATLRAMRLRMHGPRDTAGDISPFIQSSLS